jgi:hypothetical protein
MKLDPGIHIGMHLVFFGKSGVTIPHSLSLNNTTTSHKMKIVSAANGFSQRISAAN